MSENWHPVHLLQFCLEMSVGRDSYRSWEQHVFTCGFLHIYYPELAASIWLGRVSPASSKASRNFISSCGTRPGRGCRGWSAGSAERGGHSSREHQGKSLLCVLSQTSANVSLGRRNEKLGSPSGRGRWGRAEAGVPSEGGGMETVAPVVPHPPVTWCCFSREKTDRSLSACQDLQTSVCSRMSRLQNPV